MCLSVISFVIFPFKMRMIYIYRKGKLMAKGIPPTLKNLIFFRSALDRAVSLQPLTHAQDDAIALNGGDVACER
jgi:hypothetical protein